MHIIRGKAHCKKFTSLETFLIYVLSSHIKDDLSVVSQWDTRAYNIFFNTLESEESREKEE